MANGQNPGANPAPQQQRPPELPPDAINLALPDQTNIENRLIPTIPTPEEGRDEPYVWPRGLSHPNRWTQDSARLEAIRRFKGPAPAPWAPQIHEVRDVIRQAGLYFAQNGSRPQALRAARMVGHNDKYWKDYLNGKVILANLHHQQFVDDQTQLTINQRQEFALFRDAYNTYKDNGPKFQEAIRGLAQRFDDPNLLTWYDQGGVQRVLDNVSDRVNYNEALLHVEAQRLSAEKQRLDNEAERTAQEQLGDLIRGVSAPGLPTDPNREAKTPGPLGTETDATRGIGINPQLLTAAQDFQSTDKIPDFIKSMPTRQRQVAENVLTHLKNDLDNQINTLVKNPALTADEALARATEINPKLARMAGQLMNQAQDPTRKDLASPEWQLAYDLGNNIFKRIPGNEGKDLQTHWRELAQREEMLKQRYQFRVQTADLPDMKRYIDNLKQAVPRNVGDMEALITFAREMGGTWRPFVDHYIREGLAGLAGAPGPAALKTLVEEMQNDIAQITRTFGGGGRVYTVYAQRQMQELLSKASNPAQLRGQAEVLKRIYKRRIDAVVPLYNQQMNDLFGDPKLQVNLDDIKKYVETVDPEAPDAKPPPGGVRVR